MHWDTVSLKVLPALDSNARPQNKGGARQVLFPIFQSAVSKNALHMLMNTGEIWTAAFINLSRLSQIQYTNFLQIVMCTKFSDPSPQYGH